MAKKKSDKKKSDEKSGKKKQRKKLQKKAAKRPKGVPKGYHSVQPYLSLDDAAKAIDFYKAALGAEVKEQMTGPDGKVMHAEIVIGDSVVMLGQVREEMGALATRCGFYLYVEDCDALYDQAVAAGAKAKAPPVDMFWGDRYGSVEDPFGNTWSIASKVEDLSASEVEERAADFMAKMAEGSAAAGAAGADAAVEAATEAPATAAR